MADVVKRRRAFDQDGIECAHCRVRGRTTVKETRTNKGAALRRRFCFDCRREFVTVEHWTTDTMVEAAQRIATLAELTETGEKEEHDGEA